jgi:Transcriptional Coactivator p15 (PC4)
MAGEVELYEKIISENEDKGFQYRLVVNEFKGAQYLHLRKYFLSYEGEWIPSKEGATIPATLQSIFLLLEGLIEICAKEENIEVVNRFFKDRFNV